VQPKTKERTRKAYSNLSSNVIFALFVNTAAIRKLAKTALINGLRILSYVLTATRNGSTNSIVSSVKGSGLISTILMRIPQMSRSNRSLETQ
jgi:hypothetical protein